MVISSPRVCGEAFGKSFFREEVLWHEIRQETLGDAAPVVSRVALVAEDIRNAFVVGGQVEEVSLRCQATFRKWLLGRTGGGPNTAKRHRIAINVLPKARTPIGACRISELTAVIVVRSGIRIRVKVPAVQVLADIRHWHGVAGVGLASTNLVGIAVRCINTLDALPEFDVAVRQERISGAVAVIRAAEFASGGSAVAEQSVIARFEWFGLSASFAFVAHASGIRLVFAEITAGDAIGYASIRFAVLSTSIASVDHHSRRLNGGAAAVSG